MEILTYFDYEVTDSATSWAAWSITLDIHEVHSDNSWRGMYFYG